MSSPAVNLQSAIYRTRAAIIEFNTCYHNTPVADMLKHLVELQCSIDDAIDSLCDVRA